tara:strand:- start:251 stop:631 length:381 start_codon:yes stop_codon:yes gene_type:complete
MANLNDALQRNNPVLDKNAYCQVITTALMPNDSYPDQGAGPSNTITAPLAPQGLYCIISNQMSAEIELITLDSLTTWPGGLQAHAGRVGVPIGENGNLMLATGSQTTCYLKMTAAATGHIVITWFQ